MVRIAVAGIGGRMGSRIARLVEETEGVRLTGGFEHPDHPAAGKEGAAVLGTPVADPFVVGGSIREVLPEADVVIDFTSAAASVAHLEAAAEAGKAMVVGSTGFQPGQTERAGELARRIPCVLAPNMSVGVNVLFQMVGDLARLLGERFDVEIVETHHRYKKDAPSGTALKLARVAAEALGRDLGDTGVYARHGLVGERSSKEIGVQTLRGGDIVGEHTVLFAGLGERIEVTHRAHSRDTFARGAIRAATWVVRQKPGLYDMHHVLGIA